MSPTGRRRPAWFALRRSPIQGRGAFATRAIPEGTRIIEYTGERISQAEADRRYDDDAMERHHTFLFLVEDDVILDAARGGNAARFINHSCDPNCEAVIEDGRVFIDAMRDIAPGEELTYDYAYQREGRHRKEWERLYACTCGAPKCRGTILAPRKRRKRPAKRRSLRTRTTKRGTTKRGTTKRGTTKRVPAKRSAGRKR